jgi:RNA polymerase sigma-70 factor (ECF subfamily)
MVAEANKNTSRVETTGEEPPVVEPCQEDEARLVDAAVAGDPHAFAALYDHHLDRVYRHCYYRTGNRADAEDLTQQTFLQAWQAIRRYRRGSSPFVAWLLTISQNLAMSHHRKAREISSPDLTLPSAPAEADPSTALSATIMRDTVRAAILRLRPDRQQVILLRFIEDFSVAEIAATLGKTENNIRVIQHRALADLRTLLASEAPRQREVGLVDRLRDLLATTVSRRG